MSCKDLLDVWCTMVCVCSFQTKSHEDPNPRAYSKPIYPSLDLTPCSGSVTPGYLCPQAHQHESSGLETLAQARLLSPDIRQQSNTRHTFAASRTYWNTCSIHQHTSPDVGRGTESSGRNLCTQSPDPSHFKIRGCCDSTL